MSEWTVERLDRSHERGGFSCGKGPLDEFLKRLVSQYERRNIGRTYVAVRRGEKRVLGYYTLAAGSISFKNLPPSGRRKLPRHPVPVILLARLAVDQSVRGMGLGEFLLVDALVRSAESAEAIGAYAVEVKAKDEKAKSFYEKYGFIPLVDSPLHLYLPIVTIRRAFGTEK